MSSPATNVFGVGRYALSVTYDGRSLVKPASLPAILRGPNDSLTAGDIAGLPGGVSNILFQNGLVNANDTFLTAEPLSSEPGYPASSEYQVMASLEGGSAVDIYRIQAPTAADGQPGVLTVSLAELPVNGILPVASIYDASTSPVRSEILLNGNGSYVIQATGLTPGETYYVCVSAAQASAPSAGNFSLTASFGLTPAVVQTFVGGTLSASEPGDQHTLYVAETQLFQFALSTATDSAPGNAQVSVQIYNSSGAVVFSLIGRLGETVSGASILLTPGQYQVSVSVINTGSGVVPTVAYQVNGGSVSDPIGPVSADPVEEPMYPCPGNSSVDCYCYPDGTFSTVPYEVASTQ